MGQAVLSGLQVLTGLAKDPAAKLAATRGYGAEVVTYDRYREEVGSGWEASLADLKKYLEGPRERRVFVEAGLPEN